jgi:hypothetical protein
VRLAAVLAAAAAFAASAGATTSPELIVPVSVSMTTSAVTLSPKHALRGNYVDFHVRNRTAHRRTFTLAGRTIVVPPRSLRRLAIMFDVRGTYRYVSRGGGTVIRGTFRVS